MDELEEIRKKKLEQLKRAQQQQIQEQQEVQQQLVQLKNIVKQRLTKEALERFGNIKTAHPRKATQLIVGLAQAIKQGRIDMIDDNTLKEILIQLTPKKKDIKIKRI